MAKQKFGLGRGLDALISGASDVMASQQVPQVASNALMEVPLDSIIPNPRQPRRIFREDDPRLLELSASIKEHGLLQPIVVIRLDATEEQTKQQGQQAESAWLDATAPSSSAPSALKYQIIAGERRWRASRLAGLTRVPIVVKDVTPQEMFELALIENIQRADLNPIEEALAYQTLVQEFGLTHEQVAKQVGKERTTVTNSLRLLQLAPRLRDALVNQAENFSEGHARALVGIERDEDQISAMEQVIALSLNVRQTEALASRIKSKEEVEKAIEEINKPSQREPEVEILTAQFRDALMVKVDLKRNARGKGTLVLHFNNQDELEGLYNRLVKERQ